MYRNSMTMENANTVRPHFSPFNLSIASVLLLFLLSALPTAAAAGNGSLIAQVIAPGPGPEYFVKLGLGSPLQTEELVLDIDSAYIWSKCGGNVLSFNPAASSTFRYVPCHHLRQSCPVRITKKLNGRLAQDSLTLSTTNGSTEGAPLTVPQVEFACVQAKGAPANVTGVVGLSRGKWALPAQLLAKRSLGLKFAYCLPPDSNPGPIFFGSGVDYMFGSPASMNISAFLSFATLLKQNQGYALGLKGIKVDGTNLSLQPQKLHISSVQLYTKFTSPVYSALRSSFRAKAALRNITSAPAVAPFDTCFNASSIPFSRVGLAVPDIELELQGNVTWQVFGFNSVVSVSDSVVCLGFLDAGASQPSVLGTFQQQNNLIEFDLEQSRLGFSGVLDFYRTVCADFNF